MAKQSTAVSFRNYIWLADTIYSSGHISREDINRKWRANSFVNPDRTPEIPERTFHRWKRDIEYLFEINIEYNKGGGYYYIDNADDMTQEGIRTWLINTFAVNNLINESHHLKRQILFEQIPSGQYCLTPIIEAMRDHRVLRMRYRSFYKDHSSTFEISPYCIKVYSRRWYMLGLSEGYDTPRLYALDRIERLETTDKSYTLPANFDAETYFHTIVGVSKSSDKPMYVRVKVYGEQVPYFRTLPLHHSQEEVETTGDYSVSAISCAPILSSNRLYINICLR